MTATTIALTVFLFNRIAEDEAAIRDATDSRPIFAGFLAESLGDVASTQRLLAECQAKRQIIRACSVTSSPEVTEFAEWDVLRVLTVPYSDHPDYHAEWRPTVIEAISQAG